MDFSLIKFLPFVVFGLTFLFGGHYLIYRSLTGVFNISHPLFRSGLLAFLMIMPAGFFISSFIAHASQSQLAKITYIIVATWLGLAINLLLAAILIWLVSGLMNWAGLSFNKTFLGAGVFLLAAILAAYGFWNAGHPQIKNIELTIKNLPAAWQGKTLVQLSDIHLGYIYGADFLQAVVEQINAQDPDLILITGDLFDGTDGDLNVFVEPLNSLRAKEGIFFVTGNHEIYIGLPRALAVLKQTRIKVLSNEMVNLNGLQIIGLDYSLLNDEVGFTGQSSDEGKIITSLLGFDRNKPSILMYHAPINIEQAAAVGVSFQLAGHSHNGQIWPFNFFTWLIYGRYDYGLNSLGDFSIYTTNGIGTWGPPIRIGNTPEIPVFKLK
ncbi:metallophosphoesterase [Patescibacteria group bacterium]|nr:metallophosphoesterase [Patescibacteria group bacterium]